jgi:hypothetical protein
MIEAGLAQFLKANAGIAALVGDNALTRIFPLLIPEHVRGDPKKMPCLVYQRIGTTRGGTFCSTDTLVSVSMQIDCYSLNYLQAKLLADAVRTALVDYTGPMGDTHVDRVFADVEFDLVEQDVILYRVSQTYTIWFVET